MGSVLSLATSQFCSSIVERPAGSFNSGAQHFLWKDYNFSAFSYFFFNTSSQNLLLATPTTIKLWHGTRPVEQNGCCWRSAILSMWFGEVNVLSLALVRYHGLQAVDLLLSLCSQQGRQLFQPFSRAVLAPLLVHPGCNTGCWNDLN